MYKSQPPADPDWDALPEGQKKILASTRRAHWQRAKEEGRIATGTTVKRFSTQSAMDWAKATFGRGSYSREQYDYRTKRHHDLEFGADVRAALEDGRVIFVQGAGRGERAAHHRRFIERGGAAAIGAMYRKAEFHYVEFDRGSSTPIRHERWFPAAPASFEEVFE